MSHKSTPGSEPIYDARTLGLPKMLVLGLQHLFAMFGARPLCFSPASAPSSSIFAPA
mgnify:CR=1 FL=1